MGKKPGNDPSPKTIFFQPSPDNFCFILSLSFPPWLIFWAAWESEKMIQFYFFFLHSKQKRKEKFSFHLKMSETWWSETEVRSFSALGVKVFISFWKMRESISEWKLGCQHFDTGQMIGISISDVIEVFQSKLWFLDISCNKLDDYVLSREKKVLVGATTLADNCSHNNCYLVPAIWYLILLVINL